MVPRRKPPRTPAEVERRRLLRHARKVQRFDGPTPACLFCGCDRIEALRAIPFEKLPERLKAKVIERHHPDGKDISEWKVPICQNCHAIESDAQEDLDPPLRRPQTKRNRLIALLAGDRRFFQRLKEACGEREEILGREIQILLGAPDYTKEDP